MSGTITYPIELPPDVQLLYQAGMPYDFVLSWANSYRSLEFVNVPQQPDVLPVGSFVTRDGIAATTPNDCDYILCFSVDTSAGPDRVTVVARDAEVNDAYLVYGAMDRAQVNTHLRDEHNIIVREAILPNVMNATFHGQGQGPGWTMFQQQEAGYGAVGAPAMKGHTAQPVPDPSPGVNSVLPDGRVGPTPTPEQRAKAHEQEMQPPPKPAGAQPQQPPSRPARR